MKRGARNLPIVHDSLISRGRILKHAQGATHLYDTVSYWELTYSRTPEIETADLSQFHPSLNLSQFQTDCLLRITSGPAILNYLNQYLALQQNWQMKNISTVSYL